MHTNPTLFLKLLFFSFFMKFNNYSLSETIEKKIEEFLLNNPEVILKSLENYEKKVERNEKLKTKKNIEFNQKTLLDSSNGLFSGNKSGRKVLIEFFDYNCTYCKKAHIDIKKLIANDPEVKIIYKNFPILSEQSLKLAKIAVLLADKNTKLFNDFHNLVIEHRGIVDDEKIKKILLDLELNPQEIFNDLKKEYLDNEIKKDVELAKVLGLKGTPVFVINDEVIFGYVGYDELSSKLNF